MSKMKCKRLCVMLTLSLLLVCMMGTTAFAAGTGDVAGAVESTWATASTQIKTVVNNVVFPAIDLILAVFFFAKLGTAYFDYVGTDRSLYVFEAPIDMLSFITLYPENWQRHSYVACCGTSIQPVLQMLEQVPQLDTVLLCLDNDEAGHQASRRMQNQLEVRYSVERLIPENKDWNDDLTLNSENAQGLAMNEMR